MADSQDSDALTRSLPPEGSSSPSRLPAWAPWVVLGTILCLGLLGGLGLVPLGFAHPTTAPSASSVAAQPLSPSTAPSLAPPRIAGDGPKTWAEAKAGPKISAQHLVVTFEGTALAKHQNIQRSKQQALVRAHEALARARKGEDFGKLVAEYSDEPNATSNRGRLQGFTRGMAVQPFADAAFALEPGALSNPIETAFGWHVILRTQ